MCWYHVTFELDRDLEHILDEPHLGTMVCKFGRDPAICLVEEAIWQNIYRRTDRRKDDGPRAIALAHKDSVYGAAVITAEPLREFIQFMVNVE